MQKRGQFTLFVVLGIILVLAVGLFFVFKNELYSFAGISSELAYPSEVQEVVDHIQDCVDASTYEAVVNIGYTGGYYALPEQSYITDSYAVPYYLYDGEDVRLSEEGLNNELNSYITSLVDACVDFSAFSDFTITSDELFVDVTVEQNLVSVVVEYPFTAVAGESSYSVNEEYETFVDANLGWVYGIASSIVDADIAAPDEIDYTTLLSYGLAQIIVAPVDNNTYVYVLQDTTSFGGEQNMTFLFAEHYENLVSDAECFIDLDCDSGECVDGECVEEEE